MAKAAQYFNGVTWSQWPADGLTTEDITSDGALSTSFSTIKDANDNLYILSRINYDTILKRAKVIRIDKLGNVKTCYLWASSLRYTDNYNITMQISRDGLYLLVLGAFYTNGPNWGFFKVPINKINTQDEITLVEVDYFEVTNIDCIKRFAIYKDLYIWVASATTVLIYDYETKANIDTDGATIIASLAIYCSTDNQLYSASNGKLQVITFNAGASPITDSLSVATIDCAGITSATKQMLIDPFGDLIILTNDNTASTLLKYTTAGVLIDTLDLAAPSYNLAIDTKGNYYYQTALATFKIAKNTIQGQAFNPIPAEPIRATGNIGYGSNMTGYQPSVYA